MGAEGKPKNSEGKMSDLDVYMHQASMEELKALSVAGDSDETIAAAQEELSRRGRIGAQKKANKRVATESDTSYRDSRKWKDLYWNHVDHLKRTYREYTDEGENVTEEWLDAEATRMADTQYRMIEKQRKLEGAKG